MSNIRGGMSGLNHRERAAQDISSVVWDARAKGYAIGREVQLGGVRGTIVGYNISRRGKFRGAKFPMVVQTPFGVTKCSLVEIQLT